MMASSHTGDTQQFIGGMGVVGAGGDDDGGNTVFVEYVSIATPAAFMQIWLQTSLLGSSNASPDYFLIGS